MVATKSSGLQKVSGERKKEIVNIKKQVTTAVNAQFAKNAAISMLTECESKRKYHRKRMAQSFCTDTQPPAKKKSHSPDFSKVSWDIEKLKETLKNWPPGTTINWSAVAREHGIQGRNAGQVAKEFAEKHQIISHIATPKRKCTLRPQIMKLPGKGNILIPRNPTISTIENEISSMLSSGRFTLGEECTPYTLTRYKVVDSVMTPHDHHVQGRKVPLIDIRQRLLNRQST